MIDANRIMLLVAVVACGISAIVNYINKDQELGNTNLILAVLFLREYKES